MFESKKNNIFFKLGAGLSTIGNLVVIGGGKENLIEDFTDEEIEKSFKGTIVKFKQGIPYQTEIVNAISKNGKNIIIERAVEKCPMNGTSTELVQDKYQFDEGDIFYMGVTAGDFKNIDQKFSTKLDKNGGTRTGLVPNSIIFINSQGEEQILEFNPESDNGKAVLIDENNGIKLESPSLDIGNLDQANSVKNTDELIVHIPGVGNQKVNIEKINHYEIGFGDGSDGDVTISGSVTLNRDMYYNNLHIDSTGILNPNGYKIFVSGTFSGDGIIRRNGNNGQNGGNNSGGFRGDPLNQGSLQAEVGGGNGNRGNGSNGGDSNPSYTIINGVRGGTGVFAGGVKSSGGIATRSPIYDKIKFSLKDIVEGNIISIPLKGPAGSGGGGGYRPDSAYWERGGGAGGNGGVIFISAKIFNFIGTIESKGGNGGRGAWRSSGGGGGQGGVVCIISTDFQNIGTHILTGGNGGINNSGNGGNDGEVGDNGNDGITIQIQA